MTRVSARGRQEEAADNEPTPDVTARNLLPLMKTWEDETLKCGSLKETGHQNIFRFMVRTKQNISKRAATKKYF